MINQESIDKFRLELPVFEKNIRAFEAGEIDRNTLKGITGGFGSYAQKEGGYMLRLRLPGGRVSKDTLKFIVDKIKEHQIDLLKLTTCQTIQLHNLSADSVITLIRDALDFGIFTKGGGGDNPRNVMVSPLSGIEPGEFFDVYPYAKAAGEYLIDRMPSLHMPRKLKVGFSNSPENEVHATFRDLGFVARENGTFSVYCAGGLGPNPKLGVHIADGVCPDEVSLYVRMRQPFRRPRFKPPRESPETGRTLHRFLSPGRRKTDCGKTGRTLPSDPEPGGSGASPFTGRNHLYH